MIQLWNKIKQLYKVTNRKLSLNFMLRKVLAFFGIYCISAVIAEGLIILGFYVAGYDLLKGEIPTGIFFTKALPLYGYGLFFINTILFVKFYMKKSLSSIGLYFNIRSLLHYAKGMLMSVVVLILIFTSMCILDIYRFIGFNMFSLQWFIIFFVAFLIQSTTEELMCRGFLMNALHEKYSKKIAIFISSIVFVLPHMWSIPMNLLGIISIINLFLVSLLFSILFFKYGTISVCSGFHTGWNFIVSYLCGLELSGSGAFGGFIKFNVSSSNFLLTGIPYGIEASCVVTVALIIINLAYIIMKRTDIYEIS